MEVSKVLTIANEKAFIRSLKALIKKMPKSLELVAYDGSIAICEAGALRTHLDKNLNWGTAEYIDTITHCRIHTHGECI